MKPVAVRVSKDPSRPKSPWEVYYYKAGEKVRVARCSSRAEARTMADSVQAQINERGSTASQLTLPLTEAQTSEYWEAKAALGSARLITAVDFFLARKSECEEAIGLKEAIELFLESKRSMDLAEVSIRDYSSKLRALDAAFPEKTLAVFDYPASRGVPHVFKRFVLAVSADPQTRKHYKTKIGTFFSFCKAEGMMSLNPKDFVQLPNVDRGDPKVYSPQQVAKLLIAASEIRPCLLPVISLQAFLALRPTEAMRQRIEEIGWSTQAVRVQVRKKTHGNLRIRVLEKEFVPQNIWSWIEPIRGKAGLLPSNDYYQQFRRIAAKAEVPLIYDGLRHTALTNFAKLHGHDKAAELAGHKAGSYMLARHYRGLVRHEDAVRYFTITPESVRQIAAIVPANESAKL